MSPSQLLLYDAAFEGVLAVLLIVGTVAGFLSGTDFSSPATTAAVVGFAICLALLAIGLVRLASRSPRRSLLLTLSLVNDGAVLVFLMWVLTGHGFSTAGQAIVWFTIGGLALLSTLQFTAVLRFKPPSARPASPSA